MNCFEQSWRRSLEADSDYWHFPHCRAGLSHSATSWLRCRDYLRPPLAAGAWPDGAEPTGPERPTVGALPKLALDAELGENCGAADRYTEPVLDLATSLFKCRRPP